jgi:hypothetical protein
MVVYILVFAVVVVGLLLAYRAIGVQAARPDQPLDAGKVATVLEEAIALLAEPGDPAGEAALRARRLAAGVSLRAAQAASTSTGAARQAADLLGAAADDCTWAARMVESPGYASNPGLRTGSDALLEHARRCLEEVRRVAPPPRSPVAAG